MPSPDLILYNGTIYTEPDSKSKVEAIAIWNGRVLDVGSNSDILRLRARSVEVVNLQKRVVIPGLSDSHIHLLSFGLLLRTLDLAGKRSISEIRKVVEKAAVEKPPGSWITGRGWDQERLKERRFLDRNDLDSLQSHAVYLKRICGHVAVANGLALARSGIGKDTPNPKGGEIVRDPATGLPTGLLKEKALELVEDSIPRSEEETRLALVTAARKLLRFGLTSLHCIVEDALELKILHLLKNRGLIPQSIYAILPVRLLDPAVSMGAVADHGDTGFRIGGVKVYLDGSLGARTAALSEPYTDEPVSAGILRMNYSELAEVAEKAVGSGFQLCIHAIGDRAVETAVKALEMARKSRRGTQTRHRLEHASLAPPLLLRRMQRAGVVASVQPRFIYSDSWAERRLGSRRLRYLYPFRSMLRVGLKVAAGSDGPIEDPNPFQGMWAATTRPGLPPEERLNRAEALAAYTTGSAFASFHETEGGNLRPGKVADLVVLDTDPFTCEPEALRGVQVQATVIAGKAYNHKSPIFE